MNQDRRRGQGRISQTRGSHSFFVELTLEVTPADRHAFAVELEEPAGGSEVAYATTIDAALRFAEEKAYSRLRRDDLAALHVNLKRLTVSHTDTTSSLVFYAALLALQDALDIEIPDVHIDWDTLELRLKLANGRRPASPPEPAAG